MSSSIFINRGRQSFHALLTIIVFAKRVKLVSIRIHTQSSSVVIHTTEICHVWNGSCPYCAEWTLLRLNMAAVTRDRWPLLRNESVPGLWNWRAYQGPVCYLTRRTWCFKSGAIYLVSSFQIKQHLNTVASLAAALGYLKTAFLDLVSIASWWLLGQLSTVHGYREFPIQGLLRVYTVLNT